LHVQLRHRVQYLRTIPATVFFPKPEVDSALVRILPRNPLDLPARDDDLLSELIRSGFSQRRKQLRKLLGRRVTNWDHAASTLSFDSKARAENLSLLQWIGLVNYTEPREHPSALTVGNERFPVVDPHDRILRYARRSDVHGNNLRHRAVHILIFDQAGDVYLQQRSRWKDRHPLKWDSSAAGHVEAEESYEETARRELKEELGINVPLQKLLKLPASARTEQEFVWLYRGEIRGRPIVNRREIETGAFFPPAIIDGWVASRPEDFAPGFMECWKAYRKKTGANNDALT
jgi:16S rRNA (adenine1518-N6/adenine1519-N6)-dimethyltransferase